VKKRKKKKAERERGRELWINVYEGGEIIKRDHHLPIHIYYRRHTLLQWN
jgi:hypothetical protein